MSLVLRRRPGERVLLILPDGQQITVAVHAYETCPIAPRRQCAVKLLFDAPEDVRIV